MHLIASALCLTLCFPLALARPRLTATPRMRVLASRRCFSIHSPVSFAHLDSSFRCAPSARHSSRRPATLPQLQQASLVQRLFYELPSQNPLNEQFPGYVMPPSYALAAAAARAAAPTRGGGPTRAADAIFRHRALPLPPPFPAAQQRAGLVWWQVDGADGAAGVQARQRPDVCIDGPRRRGACLRQGRGAPPPVAAARPQLATAYAPPPPPVPAPLFRPDGIRGRVHQGGQSL